MGTIEELNQSVRAVYVEAPSMDDYKYGFLGSGLTLCYQGRYYCMTLHHVIKDSDPNNLVIMVNDEDPGIVPLTLLVGSKSPSYEESEIGDLRLLQINEDRLSSSQLESLTPINMDDQKVKYMKPEAGEGTIISGYPGERVKIDYKKEYLQEQRLSIQGKIIGRSTEEHLYKAELISQNSVSSMGGMSGGPVFINPDGDLISQQWRFGGIVTRSGPTGAPKYAHFIDAAKAFEMLDKLHDMERD